VDRGQYRRPSRSVRWWILERDGFPSRLTLGIRALRSSSRSEADGRVRGKACALLGALPALGHGELENTQTSRSGRIGTIAMSPAVASGELPERLTPSQSSSAAHQIGRRVQPIKAGVGCPRERRKMPRPFRWARSRKGGRLVLRRGPSAVRSNEGGDQFRFPHEAVTRMTSPRSATKPRAAASR
jgi:hypothetical protein